MKFSELWLREWVNPAIDSEALSDQITMAGLEVDGVEPVAGASTAWLWVKWLSAVSTRMPTNCASQK
jgi:phenylalanyl-tRNA synthetase beta chain